jgi:hypothetical protein
MLALGGTSYAISRLPAKSVGTKQIKRNAVNTSKVRDGSLLGTDFKAGQLPAGERGEQGLQGLPGTPGDPGARGPSDVFQTATTGQLTLASAVNPTTLASLSLPAGSFLVTGQATVDNGSNTLSGTAVCFLLRPTASIFGTVREGLDTNMTEDDRAGATPVGALTLAAPATITLSCGYESTGSTDISAADRRLVAVQVGTLTTQ